MDILAYCLAGVFLTGFFIASIYIIVCAFRRHFLWGLGYLFVPFVGLVYIIVDWPKVWKAFLMHLCCLPLMILSLFLSPSFKAEMDKNAAIRDAAPVASTSTTEKQDDRSSAQHGASSPSHSSSGSVKHHHRLHH